jgi:hypothetical protein
VISAGEVPWEITRSGGDGAVAETTLFHGHGVRAAPALARINFSMSLRVIFGINASIHEPRLIYMFP